MSDKKDKDKKKKEEEKPPWYGVPSLYRDIIKRKKQYEEADKS